MSEVKERPSLFSGEMVRAILEGRKTQTRRVISARVNNHVADISKATRAKFDINYWGDCVNFYDEYYVGAAQRIYVPGNRLWVRETWCHDEKAEKTYYRADFSSDTPGLPNWKPSIHMPRWASRITLEIVNVRVERLQDISEEDAKAEGVELSCGEMRQDCPNYKKTFHKLWDSIYGKSGHSWEANPWVWVVEFKKVDQ